MLTTFPRIYGAAASALLPMPSLGLHLVALPRPSRRRSSSRPCAALRDAERDAPLDRALAWTGRVRARRRRYFVGRSHPHVLIDLSPRGRSRCAAGRSSSCARSRARPRRRPQLAELLVLAGFGVAVCSLAQTPTPWSQVERISATTPARAARDMAVDARRRPPDTPRRGVALLVPQATGSPYELGLDDVTPYANAGSMMTADAMDRDDRGAAAVRTARAIVADERSTFREHRQRSLAAAGFVPVADARASAFVDAARRGSAADQRALEPLDRRRPASGRCRAARRGRARRGRPAAAARRAARVRVSPRLSTRNEAAAPRRSGRASARSAGAMRGCRSESSRKTALKRPSSGAPRPAGDLVVVELRQLGRERRHLRVLVELRLPAVGDRRGQAGAGDLRDRPLQSARELLRQRVLGTVRPPLGDELLGVRGGDVDLRVQRLGDAARRRRPRARSRACSRRPRAAGSRRAAGSPARPRRARAAASLPPVVATTRRAPSAPAASKRRASPPCCRSSWRTGRSRRASSTPARRSRASRRSGARRGRRAPRARARRRSPSRPCRRRSGRRARRAARASPTRRATARRAGARAGRGCRRPAWRRRPRRSPRGRGADRSRQNLIAPSGRDTFGDSRAPAASWLSAPSVTHSPSTTPSPMPAVRADARARRRRCSASAGQCGPTTAPSSTTEPSTWAPSAISTPRPSTLRPRHERAVGDARARADERRADDPAVDLARRRRSRGARRRRRR